MNSYARLCKDCKEVVVDLYDDKWGLIHTQECKCYVPPLYDKISKEELDKIMDQEVKKIIKDIYEKRMVQNETNNTSPN